MIKNAYQVVLVLCSMAVFCCTPLTPSAAASPDNLFYLSLEDAMNLQITSAAKKPQKMQDAPAAVYVLTGEDLRRSGATHVAEALRMVPGVNVGRVDSSRWAVSIRGFQSQLANKLLVLLDGRTIYSPVFGGVYWDEHEIMLEDIDRIEVIRGPGATLWGANAVNGVINIISKHSRDTQGMLVSTSLGNEDRTITSLRQGFQKDNFSMRVYARYADRDAQVDADSRGTGDDWDTARLGFRADWEPADRDKLLFIGDWYTATIDKRGTLTVFDPEKGPFLDGETTNRGGDLQARWTHSFSPTSELMLQGFYSRAERDDDFSTDNYVELYDLELQHSFQATPRHGLVWGAGYRHVRDDHEPGQFSSYEPGSDNTNLFSLFLQDEITLVADRLRLIAGSKFEHNAFTGLEIQPSVRMIWTPTQRQQLWAGVSRAVTTPNRGWEDARTVALSIPQPPARAFAQVTMIGRSLDVEKLTAYEVGYRNLLADHLCFDTAFFYNEYDDLLTFPVPGGNAFRYQQNGHSRIIIPLTISNDLEGKAYGFEINAEWRPRNNWRLIASYSFLQMSLNGPNSRIVERRTPKHQLSLRSLVNLPWNLEFDAYVYCVDRVPEYGASSYMRTDLRLGWRPMKQLDISLVGQNLFDSRHKEFQGSLYAVPTEIERSLYAKITFSF